uniref:Uncharacterized protein n=1 Tax=Arundo donax TaxID=35708 RepID=A0A0A9G477_ARUDO
MARCHVCLCVCILCKAIVTNLEPRDFMFANF